MSANPTLEDDEILSMALRWFGMRRGGEMTPAEARAFEVWLGRNPAHEETYNEVERTWAVLGEVEEEPEIMDARDQDERTLGERTRVRVLGGAAAGMAIMLVGGWALANAGLFPDLVWFKAAPASNFHTVVGQQRVITLADGTVVTLDTDSVMRVQIGRWERRVTLERGQASFQVAHERRRPFIVAAAGKTVRATGTVFDVRVEPGQLEVTLIEGRVRVQELGAKREDAPMTDMRPGWRLAIGEDTRWRMEPVDLVKATSWHDGMLVFHDDPLVDAVAEMNRYSHRKIIFKGEPPEAFVLGSFKAGDVGSFARAMELNKLARVASENEDRIELASRD